MINDKQKILISLYIDGETTPEESTIVENLLIEDASAQTYYKELTKVSKLLKANQLEEASSDLQQNLQRELSGVVSPEKEQPMKKNTFKWMTVGSGVLVALIALSVSLQTYTSRSTFGRLKDAEAPVEHLSVSEEVIQKTTSSTPPKIREKIAKVETKSHLSSQIAPAKKQYEAYYQKSNDTSVGRARRADIVHTSSKLMQAGSAQPLGGYLESTYMPEKEPTTVISYPTHQSNTEEYALIHENRFFEVTNQPLSTFSIDVDTGSYSNVRRFLNQNQLPPVDAVRIEEMINYFKYDYPQPKDGDAFSITTDVANAPWNPEHQLVRIGLKGKTLTKVPPSNLVFLIDVSGSMSSPNKLGLLKQAFVNMTNQLSANETVSIVVYAGAAGEVLKPTKGSDKTTIINAINNLQAGGSTAGGAGIQLAYKLAKDSFIEGGNNRVILATDGDFNVGISSTSDMTRLIEEKRDEGVYLTILGFGMGNYKDGRLEQIANKGNGNYYYIDTLNEANKVLVDELGSTLFTIAKDVKLQIEFNPTQVKAYRLIGYENRKLNNEDFNDDTKDAGELGAGHTVTAFYEIIPANSEENIGSVDALKYQKATTVSSDDLMTVKLRYKKPDENTSQLIEKVISSTDTVKNMTGDLAFAASVVEFGLLLRNSEFKGQASYKTTLERAKSHKGDDAFKYREEFIQLIEKAQTLDHRSSNGIQFK